MRRAEQERETGLAAPFTKTIEDFYFEDGGGARLTESVGAGEWPSIGALEFDG